MKKNFFIIFIFISALLMVSCSSQKEDPYLKYLENDSEKVETVQEKGVEVITEGIGDNRANAMIDARLRALQQVVGLQISSESKVQNFTLVDQSVFTHTKGFIKSENVLGEGPYQSDFYKVKVRFTVSERLPEDDFLYILSKMNKPKVGIWLPANAYKGNYVFEDKSAEVSIAKVLKDYGFEVYETERLIELLDIKNQNLDPDFQSLRKYGVDVLVTGEVYAEEAPGVYGLLGARANVNLKVYWTQTGKNIASDSSQKGATDISQMVAVKKALIEASTDGGTKIAKSIVTDWMNSLANGLPVELDIYNIDYDRYLDFYTMLKTAKGVLDIGAKSFEGNYANIVFYTFMQPEDFYIEVIRPVFGTDATMLNQSLTQISIKLK